MLEGTISFCLLGIDSHSKDQFTGRFAVEYVGVHKNDHDHEIISSVISKR